MKHTQQSWNDNDSVPWNVKDKPAKKHFFWKPPNHSQRTGAEAAYPLSFFVLGLVVVVIAVILL